MCKKKKKGSLTPVKLYIVLLDHILMITSEKKYSQLTVSFPGDEVVIFTLLFATHLYWPSSPRTILIIVKLEVSPKKLETLILSFSDISIPSLVHFTSGVGVPLTVQFRVKLRFCSSITVTFCGLLVNVGGSGKKKSRYLSMIKNLYIYIYIL